MARPPPFCLCDFIRDCFSCGISHALRQFVYQADVTVVDPYLLWCRTGVFLRMFSDRHPLDEDAKNLRGQLRNLTVPLGVLNEACNVGAGVL